MSGQMLVDYFNLSFPLLSVLYRRLVLEVYLHSVWVPRTNSVRYRLVRIL